MHLLLILTTGSLWLYTAARFVANLPLALGARIAIAVALLVIAEYHTLLGLAFGSFASVELPRWLLIVIGWLFGSFMLLAVLLVLRDLAGGIVFLFARSAGRTWLSAPGVNLGIAALAALLGAWGVWQGVKVPEVKTLPVAIRDLPAAFDGYRIVQLTDLHTNGLLPERWVAEVVDRTNAIRPDLIVITGDLQDGEPETRIKDVRPLGKLSAPDGVLAIPGNHEYYTDYRRWMTIFRGLELNMLVNEHVHIRRGAEALTIAGITDRQAGPFGQPAPDLPAALAGIPDGTPVILLSHRPGNAHASAAAGVALQLSGHTHGGQVLGLHFIPQKFNGGFVSGSYTVGAMQLYVSNGTGLWNGFALRIGRPSEITEIVLQAAPPGSGAASEG